MYRAEVFADKAKRADRSGKAKAAVCQISVDEATWVAMSKVLLLSTVPSLLTDCFRSGYPRAI